MLPRAYVIIKISAVQEYRAALSTSIAAMLVYVREWLEDNTARVRRRIKSRRKTIREVTKTLSPVEIDQ